MKKKRARIYSIGMLGFGNVNRAFVKHYLNVKDTVYNNYGFKLRFSAVCDAKSFVRKKNVNMKKLLERKQKDSLLSSFQTNPLEAFGKAIEEKDIDLLIDGLPSSKTDAGPTFSLLKKALRRDIHVICVNKAPLVFNGEELFSLAARHNVHVGISGTSAGSLPCAGIVLNELAGTEIVEIRGVVNGTSNYVLDLVGFEKMSIFEAVKKAVKLGIAEPDYRFDLSGLDTCFKMIILALIITGKTVDIHEIPCAGIIGLKEEYIQSVVQENKVLRLIGNLSVENGLPKIRVAPEAIDTQDPLYAVRGSGKGITFKTRYMGDMTMIGGSSGRTNIAAAILKDVINIYRK